MTSRRMTSRRILLGALAFAPLLFGSGAIAAETTDTQAAFEAARKAAKPILVRITAPWCTICAAQKPILAKLEAEPDFDLQVFDVDFDSRKDGVKRFGATMPSTLVTDKGATETGRSAGETQPEAIAALLDKTV